MDIEHKITTPFIDGNLALKIIEQFNKQFGTFSESTPEYLTPKLPKIPRFTEAEEKEYQFPGTTVSKEEKVEEYTKSIKNPLDKTLVQYFQKKQKLPEEIRTLITNVYGQRNNIIYDPEQSTYENVKNIFRTPAPSELLNPLIPYNPTQSEQEFIRKIEELANNPINRAYKYVSIIKWIILMVLGTVGQREGRNLNIVLLLLFSLLSNINAEPTEEKQETILRDGLQDIVQEYPLISEALPRRSKLGNLFDSLYEPIDIFKSALNDILIEKIPDEEILNGINQAKYIKRVDVKTMSTAKLEDYLRTNVNASLPGNVLADLMQNILMKHKPADVENTAVVIYDDNKRKEDKALETNAGLNAAQAPREIAQSMEINTENVRTSYLPITAAALTFISGLASVILTNKVRNLGKLREGEDANSLRRKLKNDIEISSNYRDVALGATATSLAFLSSTDFAKSMLSYLDYVATTSKGTVKKLAGTMYNLVYSNNAKTETTEGQLEIVNNTNTKYEKHPEYVEMSRALVDELTKAVQQQIQLITSNRKAVEKLADLLESSEDEVFSNGVVLNVDTGVNEEQKTMLVNPNNEADLTENTQTTTATYFTFNNPQQIQNFLDRKGTIVKELEKYEQYNPTPYHKEILGILEQTDEELQKQIIKNDVNKLKMSDNDLNLYKEFIHGRQLNKNGELDDFLNNKQVENNKQFQLVNEYGRQTIHMINGKFSKLSPEVIQMATSLHAAQPVDYSKLPEITKIIRNSARQLNTDLEKFEYVREVIDQGTKLQNELKQDLDEFYAKIKNFKLDTTGVVPHGTTYDYVLQHKTKVLTTLQRVVNFIKEIFGFDNEEVQQPNEPTTLKQNYDEPVQEKSELDINDEKQFNFKGGQIKKKYYRLHSPVRHRSTPYNPYDTVTRQINYFNKHLGKSTLPMYVTKVEPEKHQVANNLLKMLETNESNVSNVKPKQGCLKCGTTKNLYVHGGDVTDITCKQCLSKGITAKRNIKKMEEMSPIEKSAHHNEIVKNNQLNDALEDVRNQNVETTWNDFKKTIPSNIRLNFINRYKTILQSPEEFTSKDVNKLVILIGKWQHDEENCTDTLLLNLESMLIAYIKQAKPDAKYKPIDPKRLNTFNTLKQYLEESPESFLNILTKI
jgi:hypothetical protein